MEAHTQTGEQLSGELDLFQRYYNDHPEVMILADDDERQEYNSKGRFETLGSSELLSMLGMNPYQTRLDLWLEKTGKKPPKEQTDRMLWGKLIEPAILELFKAKTGLTAVKFPAVIYNRKLPKWAAASPDALYLENLVMKLLETKSTTIYAKKHWEGDAAPDYAQMQTVWQLGVAGLSSGSIAGVLGHAEGWKNPTIEFSQSLFDRLLDRGHDFMTLVHSDIPPEAAAGDEANLAILYGDQKAETIELDAEAGTLLQMYDELYIQRAEANKEVKAYNEKLKDFQAKIIGHLKGHQFGTFAGRVISYLPGVQSARKATPAKDVMKLKLGKGDEE